MDKKTKKRGGLGRGLSAIMADIDATAGETEHPDNKARGFKMLPIEHILPNPEQPRTHFSKTDLDNLATSIKEKGIVQPLIVRAHPQKPDTYEIVAGERRWRAAQLAKIHDIPAIVRDFTDQEVLEIAVIENIQRVDLNPIEEAQGYKQLIERFGHTQEQLSRVMGKSRSQIANMLRLLSLPQGVCKMLIDGKLSSGHARALITANDPLALAVKVVNHGLSVRETERLAKAVQKPTAQKQKSRPYKKDADTRAIEAELSAILKTSISIDHNPNLDGGYVKIRYKDLDQLEDLCRILGGY